MSTFSDINTLRKSGQLDEAYAKASEALTANPNDEWVRRAMGWVMFEYVKKSDTDLPELENHIETLVSMTFIKDTSSNAILNKLSKNAEKLKNYGKLAAWWQWDSFDDDDFTEQEFDGVKQQSLAEKAYNAYAKWLNIYGTSEQITSFVTQMESFCRAHRSRFSVYFLTQLYVKIGDKKNALRVFTPFAKEKSNMFWIWDLIASMYDDVQEKLKYICRALKCGGKDELLINLYVTAAKIFATSGYYDEAKTVLDISVKVRNAKNWRIPNEISTLHRQQWYQQAKTVTDMRTFYARMSEGADILLFPNLKNINVTATYINKEKNFVSFTTDGGVKSFAKFKNLKGISKGTRMVISVEEIAKEGPTHVFKSRIINSNN